MDEEEEEFDGASIQLTDGNERRATVAETRVKHPCRIYVGRTGTGCFLEGNDPLPGDYGLAWLLVRLAHLEVIASTQLTSPRRKSSTCTRPCLQEMSGRKCVRSYLSYCFLESSTRRTLQCAMQRPASI